MTPKTRFILFYHTKGTSLRQTTYFEPSNVKIGSGVWALQVRKNKVGKERKIKIGVGIFIHLWGKIGLSDHYQILHTCSCMLRNDFSDFWC